VCLDCAHVRDVNRAGSTMVKYASVINRAYETSGLDPPGKPVNGISCKSKSESLRMALSVLEKA
jgi:hypothetical protein